MRLVALAVTVSACTPAAPPCLPARHDPGFAQWRGTLAATTVSDGDVVALSCTTLTTMMHGTNAELALPAGSAPFALASSGASDLYVGNAIGKRSQLASVTRDGDVRWSIDLSPIDKDSVASWQLLAGPDGPVVVGYPEPTAVRAFAAADGAPLAAWNETSPPIVGIDATGALYIATGSQLRAPSWTTSYDFTLTAVQPISRGRVAVLGQAAGGGNVAGVLATDGTPEWTHSWSDGIARTIAEVGDRIAVGDVLAHYVYGPDRTYEQWDVMLVDARGFYYGASQHDADRQRWLGLAATPDGQLWASVSSDAQTLDGTEDDPGTASAPTQVVQTIELP